jgi:hypothetical protein
MKQGLTLEDKLGYWLERYAWNNCSSFDIYLLIEDYYNITEDEVSEILDMFMFELSDDANENLGIDEHVELFINKLNCHFETK